MDPGLVSRQGRRPGALASPPLRPWTPSGMIDLREPRSLGAPGPPPRASSSEGGFESKRRRASSCPETRPPGSGVFPRASFTGPVGFPPNLLKGWFSQFDAAKSGCHVYLTPKGAQVFVTSVTERGTSLPVILSIDAICVGDVVGGSARRWECGRSRCPIGSGEARLRATKRKPVPRHSEDTQILFVSPPASPTRGFGAAASLADPAELTPKQRAWREQALFL